MSILGKSMIFEYILISTAVVCAIIGLVFLAAIFLALALFVRLVREDD